MLYTELTAVKIYISLIRTNSLIRTGFWKPEYTTVRISEDPLYWNVATLYGTNIQRKKWRKYNRQPLTVYQN